MEFSIAPLKALPSLRSDCLVVFLQQSAEGSGLLDAEAVDAAIAEARQDGDFTGALGNTLLLGRVPGLASRRTLLVGLGAAPSDARAWRKAAAAACAALKGRATPHVHVACADGQQPLIEAAVRAFGDFAYVYSATRKPDPEPACRVESVQILPPSRQAAQARARLERAVAVQAGVDLCRNLANLPGNHCTPTHLGKVAQDLGKRHRLKVEVLGRAEIERERMGALLAVAQGSQQPPRFIVLRYDGAPKKQAPHVLVGKGVTFDSGGISLKPGAEMDEMKFDMSGAASVLGAFEAIARLRPAVNVVGLIPATENLPGGTAVKPGDVVTSRSGQTIEILNTDAEGRLILCDALNYAERFKPASVVDIATLTGACVIALGHVNSGLFSPDDALAEALLEAGRQTQDPCWRMPLGEDYAEGLRSRFADVANIAGRAGGSVTAACFLQRFTKAYRWAHLDIAGTAWKSGADKGATGRPVPLLVHYLLAQEQGASTR
ncbi:leucyl aminopeptidase [Thiomonas sp.]|uniref:leucyl aminopeptidase n=1 Tax=Thiomonas sp. TaxID=2047785 RepID=UPI002608E239|nr:leucyl aminopeptidase [Thiomonas sp.]